VAGRRSADAPARRSLGPRHRDGSVHGGRGRHVTGRRQVILRVDPLVHDSPTRWAMDEFRSVNSQIQMLLRRALADAGRMARLAAPLPKRGRPEGTPTERRAERAVKQRGRAG
jgi:hypothetical protein